MKVTSVRYFQTNKGIGYQSDLEDLIDKHEELKNE
jgi:hypothetical protein